MAKLRKEVQFFIVRSLAVFNTPSEVAAAVKQEYGLDISRQRCESYDPTKRVCKNLSDDLRAEFEATRKDFLEMPKNIPIANASYRLSLLNTMRDRTNEKNVLLQLKILESARAEMAQLHKIGMEEGDDDDADVVPVTVVVQVKDARKHESTKSISEHPTSPVSGDAT